jgi:tetratricopeptide (TPR) repeat protein
MQINLRYKSTRMIQAFQRGQLDEADRLALDILALDIRSSEALLVRGAIAGLEGRYADAEQLLRAALKYEKNNPSIFFNLAKALSEQKKERDALKWHRKALDLDPLNDVAWLNYGKSLYNLGEIDSAIKVYDRALAANGDLAEAHTNKGICLCEKRRFEESIAAHDRAIKLNPRLAEAWNNRGNTFGQFK